MAYNLAITSTDGSSIDLHFGKALGFHVIKVEEDHFEWLEYREIVCDTACGEQAGSACNGRDSARLTAIGELLSDCEYLLSEKIGIRPYRHLQRAGLTSLELSGDIAPIVERLNEYRSRHAVRGN